MQQRIDHLENLVKKLMSQGQETSHFEDSTLPKTGSGSLEVPASVIGAGKASATEDASAMASRAGMILINGGQSVYKATNDWSDVLQEVRGYRASFCSSFPIRFFLTL